MYRSNQGNGGVGFVMWNWGCPETVFLLFEVCAVSMASVAYGSHVWLDDT